MCRVYPGCVVGRVVGRVYSPGWRREEYSAQSYHTPREDREDSAQSYQPPPREDREDSAQRGFSGSLLTWELRHREATLSRFNSFYIKTVMPVLTFFASLNGVLSLFLTALTVLTGLEPGRKSCF